MENFWGTERLGTLMVVKLHHQISTFLHLNEHVLAKQYLVADICLYGGFSTDEAPCLCGTSPTAAAY